MNFKNENNFRFFNSPIMLNGNGKIYVKNRWVPIVSLQSKSTPLSSSKDSYYTIEFTLKQREVFSVNGHQFSFKPNSTLKMNESEKILSAKGLTQDYVLWTFPNGTKAKITDHLRCVFSQREADLIFSDNEHLTEAILYEDAQLYSLDNHQIKKYTSGDLIAFTEHGEVVNQWSNFVCN